MRIVYIYTLAHPVTGEIRYVGKTHDLAQRYSVHTTSLSHKSYTCNWIKSLKQAGLKPVMELLDQVPENMWISTEQYWISQLRSWGFKLTNLTEGGEGSYGRIPPHTQTEWYKELTRRRHSGKVTSEDTRNKIASTLTGRKDPEHVLVNKRTAAKSRNDRIMTLHVHTKDGIFFGTFEGATELHSIIGGAKSRILNVISGRAKSTGNLIIHRINCKTCL